MAMGLDFGCESLTSHDRRGASQAGFSRPTSVSQGPEVKPRSLSSRSGDDMPRLETARATTLAR
jgi:hypothetical protein